MFGFRVPTQLSRNVFGEHLWRRVHALMLLKEGANIASKCAVIGLPGGVERGGGLLVGAAYLLPTNCADSDERRQLFLAPCDGDGLLVGATV